MTTIERIDAALPSAMKARDQFATSTLRQMIAAVRGASKSGPVAKDLTDDQVQVVLVSEVKKRRESAQIYTTAGATDRADNESREADFIETYLPAVATDAQLDQAVTSAIAQVGATTIKDMGRVMKAATEAAAQHGRVDGATLSGKIRAALT